MTKIFLDIYTTEADGYHYHAASAEKNAILSCFTGMTVESTDGGRGNGGPGGRPGGGPGGPPDFAAAAAQLGISEQELTDALGTERPPDFEAAAATLGIAIEELQNALGRPPR